MDMGNGKASKEEIVTANDKGRRARGFPEPHFSLPEIFCPLASAEIVRGTLFAVAQGTN